MRQMPVKLLFIAILIFACTNASATKVTATQTGNWNNAAIWSPSTVPGCFDTIVIPAGITVTVTATVNLTACPKTIIQVYGTLFFQSGKKMDLSNQSFVYIAPGGSLQGGGGGGNSNWITINGTAYWTAGDGNITGPGFVCQACSLPVELISFEAALNTEGVGLSWTTASEVNNDYFLVQRSLDGFNWENVDLVDGGNNSSVAIDYTSQDREPLMGLSYYRLKQVDNDGAFAYSDIRVISNGNFFTNQQLLVLSSQAGPVHSVVIYFSESVTGPVEVSVTSMAGTVVAAQTVNLQDEKWIVLVVDQPLASGIYAVKSNKAIEKSFFQ